LLQLSHIVLPAAEAGDPTTKIVVIYLPVECTVSVY